MRRDFVPVVLALWLVGCSDLSAIVASIGASHSGSGGEIEASTGVGGGASTTGGDDGVETTGEGGGADGPDRAVPLRVELLVDPSPVLEVGKAAVSVWTSRPAATIDLYDGDAPLVLGAPPGNPVHVLDVTSDDVPGDGLHPLRAVARTADGVVGEAAMALVVDVQPGGTDVWPPFVQPGGINGFTGAVLFGNGVAAAGFLETAGGVEAAVTRIDGAKGQAEGPTVALGKLAVAGAGLGPAIAGAPDGAVYVAATRPDADNELFPRWAVSRVKLGKPQPLEWTKVGENLGELAHGIAVEGEVLVVVGAARIKGGKQPSHDLRVWWLSLADGSVLHTATFAASKKDDQDNTWDEVARAVLILGDEVIVVGERQVDNKAGFLVRRTVVLRYSLDGELLAEPWTSPGELLDEDAGLAVARLRTGGFIITGWGRDVNTIRQVLTRWFDADAKAGPVRIDPTPGNDAVGYAVGQDSEGKIIIAGTIERLTSGVDVWMFAAPGPLGDVAWERIHSGLGDAPDEGAGLALDGLGYVYVVGSEFDGLPQALALRLHP